MDIKKYKKLFENMASAENFDFGFVSGSPHEFYVKADGNRVVWDRDAKTVSIPEIDETKTPPRSPGSMMSAVQMVALLKGETRVKTEYYLPFSPEDEFQANTAVMDYPVLPFELVESLEKLLGAAREHILLYSIDERS